MQNAARFGTDLAIGMDVGHHIMAQPRFVMVGTGEIDGVDISTQLSELLLVDARTTAVLGEQAEFLLRLGQSDPQSAPGAELALGAPESGHRGAGVARDERIVESLSGIHDLVPDGAVAGLSAR